ncbi:MAG TPA: response regulator transcription factor [Spirochaetia bacterium]|nr:response regulator transcription factor [Spirochaetia bacterium]
MLRVLIADDHPLIRKGLKQILSEVISIQKVAEASDGDELMRMLAAETYDVVILDISMPGRDGLDLLKDIKLLYSKLPVIILSIQPEEEYALRAYRAGASGCLNKSSAPSELLDSIRCVVSGGTYISRAAGDRMIEDVRHDQANLPHLLLSDREYQVFLHISSGLTLSEISGKLRLSAKTVSTYRARLLEKMGMKTNAQLTHYAFLHNLIRNPP